MHAGLLLAFGRERFAAGDVICHRGGERLAPLYQALWRLVHGERFIDVAELMPAIRLAA